MSKKSTTEVKELSEQSNNQDEHLIFSIKNRVEAEAYQAWKRDVPKEVRAIIESAILRKTQSMQQTGLPQTDAFLRALAHNLSQALAQAPTVTETDPILKDFFDGLKFIETSHGTADALSLLTAHDVPFTTKYDVWKRHIAPMMDWLVEQDLYPVEEEKRPDEGGEEERGDDADTDSYESQDDLLPSPETDEFTPSMDEMAEQQKEGEPKAFFIVSPFYGGYYRQNVYSFWDEQQLVWRKSSAATEQELPHRTVERLSSRVMAGSIRGRQKIAIPLPYGWSLDTASLQSTAPDSATHLTEDNYGNVHMFVDADGIFQYTLTIGKTDRLPPKSLPEAHETQTSAVFPTEVRTKIAEIAASSLTAQGKARMIIKFIRDNLEYSNDSSRNVVYRKHPKKYFEIMWQQKKADCDVANTFAAMALRMANIPSRFVKGHYSKTKSSSGKTFMTSGTGHAWLEVFDVDSQLWFRADATPKGDSTLDEERPDEQDQEQGEGDYGERDAEIMSDKDLEKLIAELDTVEGKPNENKTTEERTLELFAREAECSEWEAKQVIEMFRRVRDIKDETGERVQAQLISAWKQLIQSRAVPKRDYQGPVRMSEGDELSEPVLAMIDLKAGERDVSGFERVRTTEKREQLFGGIDVYLATDLSGSMDEVDPVSGRKKTELQRDAVLLYVDSLMQCAFLSRQAEGRTTGPLAIRVQLTSFHGDISIELPLTAYWGAKEQYQVYTALVRTAGGGTPDHLALQTIQRQIEKEKALWETTKQKPGVERPITFVAAFLDGGSDDKSAVRTILHELREQGTIVYGYGMTAAARPIKAVYAPHAEVIETLTTLASMVAKDTIAVFQTLYPKRIKKGHSKR